MYKMLGNMQNCNQTVEWVSKLERVIAIAFDRTVTL